MVSPCSHHFGAHVDMVICVMIGCSKRSDHDKDVSFYRIPTVRKYNGKGELKLSIRRDGYLAAISRDQCTREIQNMLKTFFG